MRPGDYRNIGDKSLLGSDSLDEDRNEHVDMPMQEIWDNSSPTRTGGDNQGRYHSLGDSETQLVRRE